MNRSTARTKVIAGSLLAAALVAGGGVAISGTAFAAEPSASSSTASSTDGTTGTATPRSGAAVDQSKSQRPDEQLLTGTDAEKATAAALAAYPGATIQRVETDSDGVYEAHLVTTDGQALVVQMDAGFTVTGTQECGGPGGAGGQGADGGPRGHGGHGPGDGSTAQGEPSTSSSDPTGAAGA